MSGTDGREDVPVEPEQSDRRGFLEHASTAAMAGGLLASYGTLGVMAARFLYPSSDGSAVGWRFVAAVADMQQGAAMTFKAPTGAKVVVARRGAGETVEDFIALSSVCPHLGCQVHWEAHNNRFFCPCHNGVFDPEGNPLEGPPAQANQQLIRFPLKIENGLLFMEIPLESVGQHVASVDEIHPRGHRDRRGGQA